MNSIITGDGRFHIGTSLMRESLVSRHLLEQTSGRVRPMVPDVNMVSVGGRSIMDRGKSALLPLVETIARIKHQHKLVLGVGGGARARHTQAVGLDLGLPTGGLARIVGGAEEQNRDILQFLLAPHGGITLIKEHFQDLQLFLQGGMIPICIGQPPYHFWEPPARHGRLPDNGPDVGLFLMAEVIGVRQMIYLKDVDGIFETNPGQDPQAPLIRKATAGELLARPDRSLPIERELLRVLQNAKSVHMIRIINGLDANNLERALNGEDVGTRVLRDSQVDA